MRCSDLIGDVLLQQWIIPMGTDQFLNQKSTSQPQINRKSTNCQPNFNHFSTLIFQLQTWLIFGWIEVEKLILSWSLLHCYKINDFSTKYQHWGWLGKVEAQRWINVQKLICAHWDRTGLIASFRRVQFPLSLWQSNLFETTTLTIR